MEFYRRKKLNIKKNTGASVSFMITTMKTGSVEIKVTAQSSKNQDLVLKHLLVLVSNSAKIVHLRGLGLL